MSIIRELRRRNVFKVAIAYLITAWLVAQVAELGFDSFGAPDWVIKSVLFLLVIGFPIALVLAWAFELTPEGIRRESESDNTDGTIRRKGRKFDFVIITVLVFALIYVAVDRYLLVSVEPDQRIARSSIAVLPFENLSTDPENEFFAEGLSEEFLNLLAKIPELSVPARTSSFAFKGKDTNIQEIARQLQVEYVLEGSVRKSNDAIRITAQLIKAEDGYHVWSDTWDREWADIFAIQDEIAAAVVENLKIRLLAELPTKQTVDPEAYAVFVNRSGGREEQLRHLARAIAIDPEFSEAWSNMATIQANYALQQVEFPDVEFAFAEASARRAVSLDETNVQAMIILGGSQMVFHRDLDKAAEWIGKARKTDPRHKGTFVVFALLAEAFGHLELGLEVRNEGFQLNPLASQELANLIDATINFGDFDDASTLLARLEQLEPTHSQLIPLKANLAYRQGDFGTALELSHRTSPTDYGLRACAQAGLGDELSALSALEEYMALDHFSAFVAARIYSCLGEKDEAFDWLDRAYEQRDPGLILSLRKEPDMHLLKDDARWDVLVREIGLSDDRASQLIQ